MVDPKIACFMGVEQPGCMALMGQGADRAAISSSIAPQFPTQMETLFTRESWQRFWLAYFPAQSDAIAFAFNKLSTHDASITDGVLDVSSLTVDRIDKIANAITTDSEAAQQALSEIFRVTSAHRRNLHVMHAVRRGNSLVAVDENRYMYQFFGGPAVEAYRQFKLQNPQMDTMRLVLPNTLYNGRVRDELSGTPSSLHAYAAALQLSSGIGVFASENDVVYRAYGKKLEDTHPSGMLPETFDQSVMAVVGIMELTVGVFAMLRGRGGSLLSRLRPRTSTPALDVMATEPNMQLRMKPLEPIESGPAERSILEQALVAEGRSEPTVFGVGEQSFPSPTQSEINGVVQSGSRSHWQTRLLGLHGLFARALGRAPKELLVVDQGPGCEFAMPELLAPMSRKYILREPNQSDAETLGDILALRLPLNQFWLLEPELLDISLAEVAGEGADVAYAAHPFPPDSSMWRDVNVRELGPAGLLDYLGRDLKSGGFLVVQADPRVDSRVESYADALNVRGAPQGWKIIFNQKIGNPLMSSMHFQPGDDLIILQRTQ